MNKCLCSTIERAYSPSSCVVFVPGALPQAGIDRAFGPEGAVGESFCGSADRINHPLKGDDHEPHARTQGLSSEGGSPVSQLVFRYRYALHFVLYILGFTAPWNALLHLDPRGPNAHVWGILAANLSQLDGATLLASFNVLLALAIIFAMGGAFLRTWGAAYIGSEIVGSSSMHTATHPVDDDGILKDGPFAHLRNPLYEGTFLHTLALALLMPRSGAIFTIASIGLLQLWLIRGEEEFLGGKLGTPYAAYCKLVPRLWPAFKARVAPTGGKPRWVQAILGETYFWGVALSFGFAGWQYNAMLLIKCVIVSAGLSLVARALVGKPR